MENKLDNYLQIFKLETLKDKQKEILEALLYHKQDVIGLLATGYGKSICYQLPYMYYERKKFILVVSPLVSLMYDQQIKLQSMNINVEVFQSGVDIQSKFSLLQEELGSIIYITPEYIQKCSKFIQTMFQQDRLGLIAIDEAHCISSWGNDFRESYLKLGFLREIVGYEINFLLLTATATNKVQKDIIANLSLKNYKLVKSTFFRQNLQLNFQEKPKDIQDIFTILNKFKNDSIVIYCKTRKVCDQMKQKLQTYKYNCDVYTASLQQEEKNMIQQNFKDGKINILIATIAFGMGIDQLIRVVIHWGCPQVIEQYYQEIGRAGRDGSNSYCYLYYNNYDFQLNKLFLRSVTNTQQQEHILKQQKILQNLCYSQECRYKIILEQLEEYIDKCHKCDNCIMVQQQSKISKQYLVYPLFILLKTIAISNGKIGITKIKMLVRGQMNQSTQNIQWYKTFGVLQKLSKIQIDKLVQILMFNNMISTNQDNVTRITKEYQQWFNLIDQSLDDKINYDDIWYLFTNNQLDYQLPIDSDCLLHIKYEPFILKV